MEAYKRHYLTAKVATELYQLNPEFLSSMQRVKVDEQVEQLYRIQEAILQSQEAQWIALSEQEVDQALDSCIEGYDSYQGFIQALNNQHLDEGKLRQALKEELKCDKVMEWVSRDVPSLRQEDAERYFNTHRQEFHRPQMWDMSQILITVNEAYPDNTHAKVVARIWSVYDHCKAQDDDVFSQHALKYSECPSAMNNGYLGWCDETKLYPQITERLVSLASNQLSTPIETELGFHLVKYHQMKPEGMASFAEALPFLEEKHTQRARQYLQRQWLTQLLQAYPA
ncbi:MULTISPECIES: peptidylprolyl isomerase [Vibrio]|uniref:peptidylprolyl isomerase n=2 Tax=Vibrio TaxID=662 RepID=A0A7X4LJD1_9VIBR|nr:MULTISPECIES: peptidylprolyl isomerase [Vibrio]MBF9002404.1 peptidylprolyl isomerase [Vibrio nitrifigilis]MZI93014.1 peptidylprolyl isomerase [Vibrio eleionomae]